MRNRLFPLSALICLMASGVTGRTQNSLSYEPAKVKLTGRLSVAALPGEPNYESIKKGDHPEVCYFLTLTRSVTIKGDAGDENNVTEKGVKDFQLTATKDSATRFKQFATLAKKRSLVTLTGTLFHGHTGHHHTAVLMDVAAVKEEMRSAAPRR